ncbi:DUF4429 domain-containing protein [Streptomonospora salina]|uniref:DUF4429 domain-containing protein n=1 Tax=Streptomonospora salina TaxID=104205 RepID=A0A841E730_9ACTN|nr:DUF4429 domain-containing protein [Streptomonospora salina]MBB5999747.1 hypothetical protein [Streptomonospora salina]
MDELRGDRAVWTFDGEAVSIRFHTGTFKNAMLKELGRCTVPVAAVSSVDFHLSDSKRKRWALRLRMHDRTDPYTAVGAMLTEKSQPFYLVGRADSELIAENLADQIRFAAGRAAEERAQSAQPAQAGPGQAEPAGSAAPGPHLARRLVPPLPLHIQTSEGTAAFDGSAVRLIWSGGMTSSHKKKTQRRVFALADITDVEWVPATDSGNGHLRINTTEEDAPEVTKPKHDLSCLLCGEGEENARALMMAATVTAHLWTRDQGTTGQLES